MSASRAGLLPRLEGVATGLATLWMLYCLLVFRDAAGALWRDEINLVAFASLPTLADAWALLEHDPAPLASTLAMRAWAAIAPATDATLRVFGALVGVAFVGSLWLTARWLGGAPPLVSLALLGFTPTVLRHVCALRPYGLGSLFALLCVGLVWRAARAPGPARLSLAALVAVLSVQTLYANTFLVGAICLAGALVCLRRRGWPAAARVLAIGAVAALSLLPYGGVLIRSRESLVVAESPVEWAWIWGVVQDALGPPALVGVWLVLLAACILGAGVVLAGRGLRLEPAQQDLVLYGGGVIAAGMVGYVVFVGSTDVPTQAWYYLPLMAVAAAAADAVSAVGSQAIARLGRLALLICLATAMSGPTRSALSVRQTNADLIASHLAESAEASDLIVVSPWYYGVPFQRYYRGSAPWTTNPPIEDVTIHRYDLLKQRMASPQAIAPTLRAVERTLRSGGRVWLVGTPRFLEPGERAPVLPPAPHPVAGWQSVPYVTAWGMQTGQFLRSHAVNVRPVPVRIPGPVNELEDLSVFVASGWRGG